MTWWMTCSTPGNGGSDEPYFLGNIVLIKEDEMQPASEVIDGQQRLTTLTMLFCVLREMASGGFKEGLDSRIRESGDPVLGTPDRFRVNLRQLERKFFQENVQSPGKLDSFLEMEENYFRDRQPKADSG